MGATPNDLAAKAENAEEDQEKTEAVESGFDPITSQEQLDKIVQGRLRREREKYADYDELKERAKAAEDQRSELEKAVDRIKELEQANKVAELTALRARVAESTGVPASILEKSSADSEEGLVEFAESLSQFAGGVKPSGGPHVPSVGAQTDEPDRDAAARSFLENL